MTARQKPGHNQRIESLGHFAAHRELKRIGGAREGAASIRTTFFFLLFYRTSTANSVYCHC